MLYLTRKQKKDFPLKVYAIKKYTFKKKKQKKQYNLKSICYNEFASEKALVKLSNKLRLL